MGKGKMGEAGGSHRMVGSGKLEEGQIKVGLKRQVERWVGVVRHTGRETGCVSILSTRARKCAI